MCFKKSRSLFLLCFSLTITLSSGSNALSAKHSLSGDQRIISKGGLFELGFFKAGNSSNYYIGIWYKKLHTNPPTIVWVANRETPISDRFQSELKIIEGNLVLLNESNSQIWSTNVTTTTFKSVIAVILDDGKLVLREGSNLVEPFWQSFDHPAHTWSLSAKFGYNNRTKKIRLFTSWKNIEYEMRMDPNYTFSYHSNEYGGYFTYSNSDPSIKYLFYLDVSDLLDQLSWSETHKDWKLYFSEPRKDCSVYSVCRSSENCRDVGLILICDFLPGFKPRFETDWNQIYFHSVCFRKPDLQSTEAMDLQSMKTMEKRVFLMITVKNLPPNNSTLAVGSYGECRSTCLHNCSCNAYSFVDNQCSVWHGDVLHLSEDDDSGKTINIKLTCEVDFAYPEKSNLVIGGVLGLVGSVWMYGLILVLIYRKRVSVEKTTTEGSLVAFVYKDLHIATKSFSDKLGGGGFGYVFKGVLRDSSIVAVKKLESISQGEKQFRSEVSTIGTIQHVNLVRLRGFCTEGNNKLLVYDYMAQGSLDTHIFCDQKQFLSWKTRYQIALGTAKGLVYLHDKCIECIIHCDIKPENILLDADFNPKIADFGLAKLVGRDFSRVLTTTRGSIGYLAPEWLSGVAITPKADVYSYGMMLFELVYGKRNSERSEDSRCKYFPGLVANVLVEGGDILSVLDSRLNREACVEEVTKICKVACWCIQNEENQRPSMSTVERILEGLLDVHIPPVPQICHYNC